jgi:hypothetical protein
MTTAKNSFNECQRVRTSIFDKPPPGTPKITADYVTKFHDFVLADTRLKEREIAETVGTSKYLFSRFGPV